ncbi:MAG: hypothetical protein ABJA81_13420 [Nocardioidaceae bacterium]
MSHRRVFAVVSLAAATALSTAALAPAVGSSHARQPAASQLASSSASYQSTLQRAHASQRPAAGSTASERALRRYGYLVPHPAAYDRAKTRAAARVAHSASPAVPASLAPTQRSNFAGLTDSSGVPSDSTGAIGTTRYIELVNSKYGIYSRTNTLLNTGSLNTLVGASAFDNVFDPQVIWDPGTNRFYYATDQITSSGENLLALGFSKTSTPNSPADFCQYTLSYGFTDFPDYPKLGDTKDFWAIGVNVFSPNTFTGSDIIAITKPAAGSTCPDPATLGLTIKPDIKNANGTAAFTPVPANQTDPSSAGWVVARPASLPASFLTVFKITRNTTTGAAVISNGSNVTVPSYTVPANAPQSGTTRFLDTSDTRNTQAVSAIDPGHASKVGLWTQHTTAGGAGAEVRWYEIDPVAKALLQSGKATSASLFNFNGAISPDRKVRGTTKLFGANMVMNFNTSSSTTFPAIKVVSKVGTGAQSTPITVVTSAGPNIDFSCPNSGDTCRWGDYAAATPDPAASATATTGVVYGTSQYNLDGRLNPGAANWLTRNFSFTP